MSLLEDVFLEDEAGEAQELERIIEGDEYDDRPRPSTPDSNENSEKEDEAEEDKRHVDPTSAKPKRIVKNPRVTLNPARLTGPRGIQVIPEHFKDFKFKGKGREKDDLDLVLKKLEHWAYRLYPKFEFKDCLKKIETLGNKRPVVVHLTKIRTDQFTSEETVVQKDSSEDEAVPEPEDEFDKLLQQQIELARATPAPATGHKGFTTPMADRSIMPKATSSPSINDEQRERMLRNRQLAEERRLARLKLNNSKTEHENSTNSAENNTRIENFTNNTPKNSRVNNDTEEHINDVTKEHNTAKTINTKLSVNTDNEDVIQEENITRAKINRSNVIDSSDSEDDALVINESIAVDVHSHIKYDSGGESDMVDQNGSDKDVISDMVHQNGSDKDVISDMAHQNGSDKDVISDMAQQNESDKDVISDMAHQNGSDKDVISDMAHQNGSDKDVISDMAHQNGSDKDVISDMAQQNESDKDVISDMAHQNGSDKDVISDMAHQNESDKDVISDMAQQNESDKDVISDMAHQNGSDKDVISDMAHEKEITKETNENDDEIAYEKERDSNIDHRRENNERNSDIVQENETHIDIDCKNSNTDKELLDYTDDIEMNDDNINDSSSKNDQKSKDSNIEIEETSRRKKNVEESSSNDTFNVVDKNISENDVQLKNVTELNTEKLELTEKSKETELDVEDFMDVEFSDDF